MEGVTGRWPPGVRMTHLVLIPPTAVVVDAAAPASGTLGIDPATVSARP